MSVIGACHFRLNVCLNGLQPEHNDDRLTAFDPGQPG